MRRHASGGRPTNGDVARVDAVAAVAAAAAATAAALSSASRAAHVDCTSLSSRRALQIHLSDGGLIRARTCVLGAVSSDVCVRNIFSAATEAIHTSADARVLLLLKAMRVQTASYGEMALLYASASARANVWAMRRKWSISSQVDDDFFL